MSAPELAPLYTDHVAELQRRTQGALARAHLDHLVVPAGTAHTQAFDDMDYPYKVNPHFKAWVPLTQAPGSWLVATPGERPRLVFLQPRDYWHVVPEAPAGYWVDAFDVTIVRSAAEARAHLPPLARSAVLGEPQSALGDYAPNNPAAVIDHLHYHRAFKTPYELALMRRASLRGARAHRAAEAAFRTGASEFDIHLAYCAAARQDANDLPYGNIIALNTHAAVLHYMQLAHEAPAVARSFLIDAGASEAGYACDITRTHAADTDGEFQALIDAVDAAQRALCDQVRAGVDYRRIHLDAHLALAGVLRDFGIVRMAPEDAVASGVSAAFFPHGVGHGIGLQVHDVAGFAASDTGGTLPKPDGHPYLRLTRTLAPGMVVTIEPGLYFIDMLLDPLRSGAHARHIDWSRVDAFRPYGGIRIEDDVVCTEGTPENLTRDAFASVQ